MKILFKNKEIYGSILTLVFFRLYLIFFLVSLTLGILHGVIHFHFYLPSLLKVVPFFSNEVVSSLASFLGSALKSTID